MIRQGIGITIEISNGKREKDEGKVGGEKMMKPGWNQTVK